MGKSTLIRHRRPSTPRRRRRGNKQIDRVPPHEPREAGAGRPFTGARVGARPVTFSAALDVALDPRLIAAVLAVVSMLVCR